MKKYIISGLIAVTSLSIVFSNVWTVSAEKWDTALCQKFIANDKPVCADALDTNNTNSDAINSEPFPEVITENNADAKGVSENTLSHEIEVNISSVDGKTFVKSCGNHLLNKGEKVNANINWNGDGSVMVLYTKDVFNTEEITALVDKGILPLNANNKTFNDGSGIAPSLSCNFTYTRKDKELKLNFITTPNNPISWSNEVPETADYYIYVIATGDTGIKDIQGSITLPD